MACGDMLASSLHNLVYIYYPLLYLNNNFKSKVRLYLAKQKYSFTTLVSKKSAIKRYLKVRGTSGYQNFNFELKSSESLVRGINKQCKDTISNDAQSIIFIICELKRFRNINEN